jgi:hypothetical protein
VSKLEAKQVGVFNELGGFLVNLEAEKEFPAWSLEIVLRFSMRNEHDCAVFSPLSSSTSYEMF